MLGNVRGSEIQQVQLQPVPSLSPKHTGALLPLFAPICRYLLFTCEPVELGEDTVTAPI